MTNCSSSHEAHVAPQYVQDILWFTSFAYKSLGLARDARFCEKPSPAEKKCSLRNSRRISRGSSIKPQCHLEKAIAKFTIKGVSRCRRACSFWDAFSSQINALLIAENGNALYYAALLCLLQGVWKTEVAWKSKKASVGSLTRDQWSELPFWFIPGW